MSSPDAVKYEGCGEEGPIRNIFFAEFHPTAGPIIRCQAPGNSTDRLSKEVFDAISVYVIPKQQLERRTMTVNVLSRKISGYPIIIENEKYNRNQYMFNLCFVCYPWSRTAQYEPALIKLTEFLVTLEMEQEFLSKEENTEALQKILEKVFHDLNSDSRCTINVDSNILQLKVNKIQQEPTPVHDYDVPVLMIDPALINSSWDLTTQQLMPFIDGLKHVGRIAAEAGVETSLVRAAVQGLVYHRVLQLVPIFQFSNVYTIEPEIRQLRENEAVRAEVLPHIVGPNAAGEMASFRDVYEFMCAFKHGTTVRDLYIRFNPKVRLGIDVCQMIRVLILKKFLRRVHKYPVYVSPVTSDPPPAAEDKENPTLPPNKANGVGQGGGSARSLYHLFDGKRHYDEICCITGFSAAMLDELIENDPHVFVLRK